MLFAFIVPDKLGRERRTFKCKNCGKIETKTI
jgi:peptide subunit release factor 1 (eRF1)